MTTRLEGRTLPDTAQGCYICAVRRFAARTLRPVLLAGLLAVGTACGYALYGSGLTGVERVAIRTPENRSQEPGIEFVIADALRRELLRRESAALVEDPGRADLVVSGQVLEVRSSSRGFSSAVLAREHDLDLRVRLQAVRADGREVLAGSATFSEHERYLASADIEAHRRNRQEALRRLSGLLAARFFDTVGERLP